MTQPDSDDDPFRIDVHNLDRELIVVAQKTRAAGLREADARHEYAKAEARLAVCAARLSLKVRQNPRDYALPDKPTVDAVGATVLVDDAHQKAVAEVNSAKFALDVAKAEVTAMLDYRKAVERLVELLALEYFSEKEPRAHGPKGRDKQDELARRAVRQGIDSE